LKKNRDYGGEFTWSLRIDWPGTSRKSCPRPRGCREWTVASLAVFKVKERRGERKKKASELVLGDEKKHAGRPLRDPSDKGGKALFLLVGECAGAQLLNYGGGNLEVTTQAPPSLKKPGGNTATQLPERPGLDSEPRRRTLG